MSRNHTATKATAIPPSVMQPIASPNEKGSPKHLKASRFDDVPNILLLSSWSDVKPDVHAATILAEVSKNQSRWNRSAFRPPREDVSSDHPVLVPESSVPSVPRLLPEANRPGPDPSGSGRASVDARPESSSRLRIRLFKGHVLLDYPWLRGGFAAIRRVRFVRFALYSMPHRVRRHFQDQRPPAAVLPAWSA